MKLQKIIKYDKKIMKNKIIKIAEFQKTSLLDYPGKVSSIVFTLGCNFRCKFCYVPHLVLPERVKEAKEIEEKEIFSYLEKNKKFIDAVVITGGEPTINADLPELIKKIKEKGFLVAIETNGSNFEMLKNLVENKLVDYIEMDIKTKLDFEKYKAIVGELTKNDFENVKKSIKFLINSKANYEFRTTLVKEFHTKEDIIEICKAIKGAEVYFLQNLKRDVELLSGKELSPFSEEEIKEIIDEGKKYVNVVYRKHL